MFDNNQGKNIHLVDNPLDCVGINALRALKFFFLRYLKSENL